MQGRPPSANISVARRRDPAATFAAECGLRGPLRFMVENSETGQAQTFDVFEPFVLIGRAPGSHLQLLHHEVCFRHAYCQVIQGRLYVFDLDSQHGTAWGAGLRREGPLTSDSRLQIGPFVIRLSRAPAFTSSLEPTPEDWEPENEPLENVRLWFENATGRSSQSAMRPMRRQITILGRSNRSHLKLSDSSVSKAHCAIVRTGMGYWVVDLMGRSGTLLNDGKVRFAPVGPDDRIGIGRFRVRIRELMSDQADSVVNAGLNSDSTDEMATLEHAGTISTGHAGHDALAQHGLVQAQENLALHSVHVPSGPVQSPPGTSDALILAMMDQFSHLQQQLLTHTQQQMSMLTEMFATLHKAQNDAVMDQLHRIQEITSELNTLRAERKSPQTAEPAPSSERVSVEAANSGGGVAVSTMHTSPVPTQPPVVTGERVEVAADDADSTANSRCETMDDSDVVPIGTIDNAGTESEVEPSIPADVEGAAIEDQLTEQADCEHNTAAPVTIDGERDTTPTHKVSATNHGPSSRPRHDSTSHARLTMRISELERERNSRWKRLMQLVGGPPAE